MMVESKKGGGGGRREEEEAGEALAVDRLGRHFVVSFSPLTNDVSWPAGKCNRVCPWSVLPGIVE